MDAHRSWAAEEFGDCDIADARLTYRLVRIAAGVVRRPVGVVARVFDTNAERQATYDLLANSRVPARAVVGATCRATARRCPERGTVRVIIDGTSASLSDPSKSKEIGPIGANKFATRGVKVVNVYAVDESDVPIGLLDVETWRRTKKRKAGSRLLRRRLGQTEMAQHWCPALERALECLAEVRPEVRPWIVGDRECDDARFLRLASGRGTFTVRAAQNRLVETPSGRTRKLFSVARAGRLHGTRELRLRATPKRRARTAKLEIRVAKTSVLLPVNDTVGSREPMRVSVVHVREVGAVRGKRLEWILLTNAPVETPEQIEEIIASYRARWRIEEYHRTWKAGGCRAASTQIRSLEGIAKWITILGAVAARAERLKHLSRTDPDAPATIELTELEIVSLILAKRRAKSSVETVPDGVPTIAVATQWIADLGGFSGHYKKYKPGATTIMRGLERLAMYTEVYGTVLSPREIKRRLR